MSFSYSRYVRRAAVLDREIRGTQAFNIWRMIRGVFGRAHGDRESRLDALRRERRQLEAEYAASLLHKAADGLPMRDHVGRSRHIDLADHVAIAALQQSKPDWRAFAKRYANPVPRSRD